MNIVGKTASNATRFKFKLSDKPQRFLSPEKPRDFPLGPENNKNHQGRPHKYKSPFLSNDGLGLNKASVTF